MPIRDKIVGYYRNITGGLRRGLSALEFIGGTPYGGSDTGQLDANSILDSCLRVLGDGMASLRPAVYDADGIEVENHPLPAMITPQLLRAMLRSWALTGNAVVGLVENGGMEVVRLQYWPYRYASIGLVGSLYAGVMAYQYAGGYFGGPNPAAASEVLHWMTTPDSEYPWIGRSPLAGAGDEVRTDAAAATYVRAFMANLGQPSVWAMPKDMSRTWTPEQRKTIREAINEGTSGENAGRPIASSIAVELWQPVSPRTSLDIAIVRGTPEARIAGLVGVPPAMAQLTIGLQNTSTNATHRDIRNEFAEGTLQPLSDDLADAITEQVLRPRFAGSETLTFRFDTSGSYLFRRDLDAATNRAVALYAGELATHNEAREIVELPWLEGGDEFKARQAVPPPMMPPQAPNDAAPSESEQADDNEDDDE